MICPIWTDKMINIYTHASAILKFYFYSTILKLHLRKNSNFNVGVLSYEKYEKKTEIKL